MKKLTLIIAIAFLIGGTGLGVVSVVSTLYEGSKFDLGSLSVVGAIFAAAGLLALRDRI